MAKHSPEDCYRTYLAHKRMYRPNIAVLKASADCGFGTDINGFWRFVRSNRKGKANAI